MTRPECGPRCECTDCLVERVILDLELDAADRAGDEKDVEEDIV